MAMKIAFRCGIRSPGIRPSWDDHPSSLYLPGGFNLFQKYWSILIISPSRVENKTCLTPPPRYTEGLNTSYGGLPGPAVSFIFSLLVDPFHHSLEMLYPMPWPHWQRIPILLAGWVRDRRRWIIRWKELQRLQPWDRKVREPNPWFITDHLPPLILLFSEHPAVVHLLKAEMAETSWNVHSFLLVVEPRIWYTSPKGFCVTTVVLLLVDTASLTTGAIRHGFNRWKFRSVVWKQLTPDLQLQSFWVPTPEI